MGNHLSCPGQNRSHQIWMSTLGFTCKGKRGKTQSYFPKKNDLVFLFTYGEEASTQPAQSPVWLGSQEIQENRASYLPLRKCLCVKEQLKRRKGETYCQHWISSESILLNAYFKFKWFTFCVIGFVLQLSTSHFAAKYGLIYIGKSRFKHFMTSVVTREIRRGSEKKEKTNSGQFQSTKA